MSERNRRSRFRVGPRVEPLEGRVVLSTFQVSNVDQLAAAAAAVSGTTTPNTIVLARGSYNLLHAIQIRNAGDLTIKAQSAGGSVVLRGGVADRILDIEGGRVTLSNLTITGGGGVAQGGGVFANGAQVMLQSCTVSDNRAGAAGAGVFAQGGSLTVSDSTISGNQASSATDAEGGGIAAVGAAVSISGGVVSGNEANAVNLQTQGPVRGAGGAIAVRGGSLELRGVALGNNLIESITLGPDATAFGGAIEAASAGVRVVNCSFLGQSVHAFSTGGAAGRGGSIAVEGPGASLSISGSTFKKDTPDRAEEFYHPGVTVSISTSAINGRRFAGAYTLGEDGFTPAS